MFDEADKKKGDQRKPIGTEEVWDSIMLAELLISLPKPEPEPPKPLKKAKIHLKAEGKLDRSPSAAFISCRAQSFHLVQP